MSDEGGEQNIFHLEMVNVEPSSGLKSPLKCRKMIPSMDFIPFDSGDFLG